MGESKRQEAETESLIGVTIAGRYKIVSLIARGGMGKVFRAEQSALGRICALKVLSPNYEGDKDPEFHRRFSLEAATAAKLQHPNTVTIFDYGKCDDPEIYYIAMEYLDGRTLHRVLHDERTIEESRASHIAQQICRSVAEAHRLGVVHRDLKPSNVLLVERGDDPDFVKVLDFGLVKDVSGKGEDLTQTGLFMGSPKYMAPEQVLGGEISAKTDVYALGVMLYEMICGKVPFDRKAGMSTLIAHVNEKPPPLTERDTNLAVSPEMESIVMRCLEKDPARRYASMKDLLAALKRAGGDLTETSESLPRARIPLEALRPVSSATPPAGAEGPSSRSKGSTPPPSGTMRSPMELSPSSTRAPAQPIPAPSPSGPSGPVLGVGADSLSPPSQVSRTFTADRAPPPAWRPYVLAVVTSVLGGGTAALVLSRHNDDGRGPRTTESAAPTVAVAVALPVSAEPPRAPGLRIVTVETDPSGAGVSELGVEVCMATPCRVYWTGDSASAEHKLNLFKKGYRSSTLVVSPGQDKVLGKLEVPPAGEAPPPPPVVVKATATAAVEAAPIAATVAATPVPTPTPTPTPVPTPAVPDPVAAQPTVAAVAPEPAHSDEPIVPPTRVSAPPPAYSREALEAKVSGTVVAKCQITVSGSTSGCRIIKGIPFMDGPVLAALAGWKFTPATQGGKPVAIDQVLTIKMAPH